MAGDTSLRRSGRKRTRKSYAETEDGESSKTRKETLDESDVSDEDDEFQLPVNEEPDAFEDNEDGHETDDDEGQRTDEESVKKTKKSPSQLKQDVHGKEKGAAKITNGAFRAVDHMRSTGKKERYTSLFGTGVDDLAGIIQTRDRFAGVVTLPFKEQDGGFCDTFFRSQSEREAESEQDWAWYDKEGGKETFEKYQKLKPTANHEFLVTPRRRHRVLFGPDSTTPVKILRAGESIQLPRHASNDVANQALDKGKDSSCAQSIGWMLNVGNKVQSMAWAPNRGSEDEQILALSTMSLKKAYSTGDVSSEKGATAANAFVPTPSTSTEIQLWAFASLRESEKTSTLDGSKEPSLVQVLNVDAGYVREIQWCPAPRLPTQSGKGSRLRSLGLLAFVSSDGYLRVLDIQLPVKNSKKPSHVHVSDFAFVVRPPSTICTCVTWQSSSHVAAGCANGYVAVWDIAESFQDKTATEASALRPMLYMPLHQTYVLSIVCPYPSQASQLTTASADGYVRLSSLSDPHTNSVLSQRSRIVSPTVVWSEHVQSALYPDESNSVKALPFRRFYSSLAFAKTSASTTAMATSLYHPSVLVGTADGKVSLTSPLRKVIAAPKNRPWMQTWFSHEWTASGQAEPESSSHDTGISRILEGSPSTSEPLVRGTPGVSSQVLTTIYEEATAVSSLAWNPNLACAGWAAAGMASGLLRVEDVAF